MKNKFLLFMIISLFSEKQSFSQSIDASLFFVKSNFEERHTTPMFYGVYSQKSFWCHSRVNSDWNNTLSFYPGRNILSKNKNTYLVLETGILLGEYWGVGPEIVFGSNLKKINYSISLEMVKNLFFMETETSRKITESFLYTFSQIHYKIHPNEKFVAGISNQFFYAEHTKYLDTGIDVKLKINPKGYLELWVTTDPLNSWRNKINLGVGTVF